jgi:hypothetical protein
MFLASFDLLLHGNLHQNKLATTKQIHKSIHIQINYISKFTTKMSGAFNTEPLLYLLSASKSEQVEQTLLQTFRYRQQKLLHQQVTNKIKTIQIIQQLYE